MALRLLGHENMYVTSQDIYNLRLLVHHLQLHDTDDTTWAQCVLPFMALDIFHCNCAASSTSTFAISETAQLACFGEKGDIVPPDLGPVVAVAGGYGHTCAVKASGELACFGFNNRGQCDVPADLSSVVAVAAGIAHTCAVKASGELVCFGDTGSGQCDVPPDLGSVVAVAAGIAHTCAVKTTGELVCFGCNPHGQCDVPRDLAPVVAVAAGIHHTCAVKATGELVCFGDNEYGQCDVPPDLGPVVAVAAADNHTCALKASGELVCFGNNDHGQCAVPADLGPVVAVTAGHFHTCAVKASGKLVCFGRNQHGQLDVPPDFKALVAPRSSSAATHASDQSQEVLQPVHHVEPPAEISEEEGAAIVAEQEATWIEHNIGSGWHGSDLQSRAYVRFSRVVHMTLRNVHEKLNQVLEQSLALQPCRQALQEEGLDWRLQPSGAKIFMEPWCFRAIRSHLSTMRLRPCDIFVSETLENEVTRVIRQIPRSLGIVPRSSQNIAFADENEEVVLASRSFLNIPATALVNPASVAQSTTEARTRQGYHGTNPRRFQANLA